MSFGGHVFAMINSLKGNKKLRERNSYFKNHRDYKISENGKTVFTRNPTEKEIQEVKSKIKQYKADKKKALIIALISALFIIVGLSLLFRWFIMNEMELF